MASARRIGSEILVVGLASIVVGEEMTEVFQLREAQGFVALSMRAEAGRETAPSAVVHSDSGRAALSKKPSRAAQSPTIPSPTQSETSTKAPGARGIVTGTACSIAVRIAAFSKKSHIVSTRLTTSSARPGLRSDICSCVPISWRLLYAAERPQ